MAKRDWRTQFRRVRQMAEQNLGRVEKTEALNADLQALEKKVDSFGKVFDRTGKKLQACLQSQPAHDMEKRQKRLPEYALAQSLTESSALLGLDSLLGQIFQICGDAQQWIAYDMLKHELSVENDILAPIHTLLETDIPAIVKHKRSLQKMVLDMDSAKTRYTAALKSQQAGETKAGRVDNLRDEYEEACYKVDQLRDQLATGMFKLASKESELSRILLQLIKCQADFHRTALENLEKRMPQMEEQIEFWNHMPVYGKSLEDHLRRTDRTIALVIEESIKSICILGGLEEEGLFRIAGAANKVKKLKAAFDLEQVDDITEEYDVHCIAGCLKQYLRELPDPLMTCALYPDWMQAAHLPADQRLSALNEVLQKLPKVNYDNLRYLIKFLAKLTEFQEINKMSPSNIAIVIGPNLIWPEVDGGPCVLATTTLSAIVEALISHCDSYFFPGDIDFGVSTKSANSESQSSPQPDDILRDKLSPTPSSDLKRHGLNAGLGLAHQGLMAPLSVRSSREISPSTSDRIVVKVDPPGTEESTVGYGALGPNGKERPAVASGHNSGESRSGSATDGDSNGRYTKHCSRHVGDGKLIDSVSEPIIPATLAPVYNTPLTRAVTPPPKGPPDRGVHSDVYNTVFALQSLGDGWSDYLTRVRTLWDGHMNQRTSLVASNGVGGSMEVPAQANLASAKGRADSDEDIFEQIVAPNNHQEFTAPPDLLNSTPALATAPFQSYNAGLQTQHPQSNHSNQSHRVSTPDLAQHGHPAQNLIGAIHWTATSPPPSDPMTASTGSLTFNEGSMKQSVPSPKPPRRVYKKPAPLPPGERPVGPAPPPPVPSPSNVTSPPSSASTGPGVHGEKPALPYPVKPPPPERISSAVSEQAPKVADKPDRPPSPTRARPNIPPPERPTQPDKPSQADRSPQSVPEKPDKPEKPSKPNINPSDKLYPSLPPVSPSRTSSGDNSPPQTIKQVHVTEVGEKPPLPPPPAKPETSGAGQVPGDSPQPGHKRQGSSGARPPRPQPPPPPPPVVKPIVITEDKTNDANPEPSDNTEQRTPLSPKEQTYL